MTTVRLLATYDQNPPQTILDLDSALATSLVADGNASLTLTGGVRRYKNTAPPGIAHAERLVGPVTLIANRSTEIQLPEGSLLTVTGDADAIGTVQHLDADGAVLQTWTVSANSSTMVGPYVGEQRIAAICDFGGVTLTPNDAASDAALAVVDDDGNIIGLRSPSGQVFKMSLPPLSYEIGWRPMGLTNSEGSGGGRTWCYKTICPDAEGFDAVRISIRHASTSADTKHTLLVAVTETAGQAATTLSADINRWRPVVNATEYSTKDAVEQYGWKSVTFDGAATITPVACTVTTPMEYFSDWIPLKSVPRGDGGTFPLIMLRDLVTGTGAASSFTADIALMNTATAANAGFIVQAGWTANDFVTTINNTNGANPVGALTTNAPVVGIHFRTRRAGVCMLGIGDSLTQCGGVVADILSSWGLRTAAAVSALGIPCGYINNGFATRDMGIFTEPGLAAIADWKPNAVVCEGFSPNGPVTGGYSSDAIMRRSIEQQGSMVQQQITAAKAIGAKVFVTTGIPTTSATMPNETRDAMRRALNTIWMAKTRDVTPVDFDALVTDGATPARIKSAAAYEAGAGNGLHVNETYVALEANLLTTAVKNAFGIAD